MAIINMVDLDLQNKRVLIREDLNVPVKDGVVTSDARLRAALPTIKLALEKGAAVMVMSHLGRPTEGEFNAEFSLQPVVDYLVKALDCPVRLATEYLNGVDAQVGEVVVFENVRFNPGEKKNDEALAKKMAALCDVYVMDAFGTAHRAQASTHGVGVYAPIACAGPLLAQELDALAKIKSREGGVGETILSQLLTEIEEGISSRVAVVGITNRPDIIDNSLLRTGRLDLVLYVSHPDEKGRLEIIKTLTKKMPLTNDVKLQEIAIATQGHT